MRAIFGVVALGAALAWSTTTQAADLRAYDDACLHAVQFIDQDEGWAVGDEGAVWHTIDSGQTWERQPTGVRASLRSLHFLNPYTGWVVGREELPHGAGSAGVLLVTRDGGLRWRRVTLNALPGLNRVRFLADGQNGFVAGDGNDQCPSGLFHTTDAGRTWQPIAGPRCPSWLAAEFQDAQNGALAGAWDRLALLRQGTLVAADIDTLGGRNLRDLCLQPSAHKAVAVGQGGLVLLNDNTAEPVWGIPDLGLPLAVRASLDLHAVQMNGQHIWATGRPGSVVLHSANGGASWQVQRTGQPLPLDGLFFLDAQHGWAVGEYGTIVGTHDGGQTWQVQHRGGQRAALLFVHARPTGVPVETLAALGADNGYLATALCVEGADPSSAVPSRASEPQRLAAAVRLAGGAAAETLWQFPVPQHLGSADRAELVAAWDRLHDRQAAEQLVRQLVLALRMWRPEVIVTDNPDARSNGCPGETLVAEAVREAFLKASDAKAFPEHVEQLGLEPWQPAKLYACWRDHKDAHVDLDVTEVSPRLETSARDFAGPAAALLANTPTPLPARRFFRLLAGKDSQAANQHELMEGCVLPPGGVARRDLGEIKEPAPELVKAVQARRNLEALAETPANGLTDPGRLLGQLRPALEKLPPEQAAEAAFAVASQYVRQGQWTLAREAFLLLVDRYPAHPLAADAYRWLIRYNSSSEARRRQELGQFAVLGRSEFTTTPKDRPADGKDADGPEQAEVKMKQTRQLNLLGTLEDTRRWYQGCLEVEPRLAAFGPLFAADPSLQFCLQAARRNVGDFETAQKWYRQFAEEHRDGPWHELAATELWLSTRTGPPPRPVAPCRLTDTRPFLDGRLDEPCWTDHRPLVLHNAVGDTSKDYPTEVWLAYDKEFLYLALRCRHPADRHVEPVKPRPRDADVRPFDRVNLLLDLDRDYNTCFRLQIDQRGCVCEDCWGDLSWNPRWFVALHSEAECWQIEAAIPLVELTGDTVTVGHAWACNVVRVLPGRGVQAFSLPADVEPRLEGMGLLMFLQEKAPTAPPQPVATPMNKVP